MSRPLQMAYCGAYVATFVVTLSNGLALAQTCTVLPQNDIVVNRQIQLDINCPAPFFKLSESPDFQESEDTGVVVAIGSIDSDGQYADISIQYPNGSTGDNPIPFSVLPLVRQVRILAVLFNFAEGALAPPAYATPNWVQKLIFDGHHDGRGLANSIKAHIEQNTYGRVILGGEVYPNWVEVGSIETYRDLNLSPTPDRKFADDIVQQLVDNDPDFFAGKDFDFLIALTPGGLQATTLQPYSFYSQWPDPNGIFEGWAIYDLPIENNSQLYNTIVDEVRVSASDTIVIPRYNPSTVAGVWLATDVQHTGTNYYTGGSVGYDVSNPNHFAYVIHLGSPLPAANTEVIVTYQPRAYRRLSVASANDTMPDTFWFGLVVHELYHATGWLLNPLEKSINDLYQSPAELIANYDLMSQGNWNEYEIDGVAYYVPGNLSAYSKVNLGIVQPYELAYGQNVSELRLYRAEESDFFATDNRIKAIKVPLTPSGEISFQQLVKYPNDEIKFAGPAYLLLEWRDKGALDNSAFNFDAALPHAGLVVSHIIEAEATLHGYNTLIRTVDATPPTFPLDSVAALRSEEVFSMETSAAPLGVDSGVYRYVASAPWNWKARDTTTADLLLSPGNGVKTIYAKFMDLNGQIVQQTSVPVILEEPINTPPVADAGPPQNLTDDGDGAEWVTLDGSRSYDPDGTLSRYEWNEAGAQIASGITPTVSLGVGAHTITLAVFDNQNASASSDVLVTVTAAVPNMPPVADAGADQIVADGDSDGVATVTLDGSLSSDPDGAIQTFDWYENGVLLDSGMVPTVNLPVGEHGIILTVTDEWGASSNDLLIVCVSGAPSQLVGEVASQMVTLRWADNSCNEDGFRIELGQKAKGKMQFSLYDNSGPDTTTYSASFGDGTYEFRIQAEESGLPGYSNTVSVTVGSSTQNGGKGGKKP